MVLIFRKAGYSGIQIVLLFIPLVNVIVFVWFALTEWPVEKELKSLRALNKRNEIIYHFHHRVL